LAYEEFQAFNALISASNFSRNNLVTGPGIPFAIFNLSIEMTGPISKEVFVTNASDISFSLFSVTAVSLTGIPASRARRRIFFRVIPERMFSDSGCVYRMCQL